MGQSFCFFDGVGVQHEAAGAAQCWARVAGCIVGVLRIAEQHGVRAAGCCFSYGKRSLIFGGETTNERAPGTPISAGRG